MIFFGKPRPVALAVTLVAGWVGCTHTVKVEPIKVEPIDITLHIYLEADKKLDEFFGDQTKPANPPSPEPGKEGGAS